VRILLVRARLLLLSFSGAAVTLACGDQSGVTPPDDPAELGPDSPASAALFRLGARANLLAAKSSTRLDAGTRHRVPIGSSSVSVRVEDYVAEGDRIALTGSVEGSERSSFLLKSDGDELFGWVVLRDRHRAYLYQSVNGVVEVHEVPVERIYPVCNLPGRKAPKPLAHSTEPSVDASERVLSAPSPTESWIGNYNNEDLYELESRPGADKVLFLDLTEAMNGDTPRDFSKEEMWKAWASVAAGFSSFDVNVTTDSSVYSAAGVTNSGVAEFFPTNETANCPLGAFGTRLPCLLYTGPNAEPEEGYGLGRSTLHELGHLMGLDHDGTSSEEYAPTIREFDWAPIMGNYYTHSGDEALNQWSKGEYSGANHKEDDLAIITENLPYRADDLPDSKPLQLSGTSVTSTVNRGQIASNTDSDRFTFSIAQSGGHATLNISRIEYYGGSMLDVDARLLNGNGTELAASNPKAARGATINLDLPVDSYTLVIKGGAEGTPTNGFSNYSSLGYYGIQGTITGASAAGGGAGGGAGAGGGGAGGVAGSSGSNLGGSASGSSGAAGATSGGGFGGNSSGGNTSGGSGFGGNLGGEAGGGGNGVGGTSGSGGSNAGSGNIAGLGNGCSSGASVAGGAGAPLGGAGINSAGSTASAGSSPTEAPAGGSKVDEGCGCKVAGRTRSGGAPAQLGLVGIAVAVLGMRRRRRALV